MNKIVVSDLIEHLMKAFVHTLIIMATLALSGVALAGGEKIYEVTGRFMEPNEKIDCTMAMAEREMVVQKGRERLLMDRDKARCNIEPKVGDTVTVHYRRYPTRFGGDILVATEIEVKAAKGSKE